ncbi:hypothetical protein A3G56_01905 [Candidatus Falkowbacteria bacterium RIFCSPLOWO2_12_FULL_45_10]|uniref:Uncharacterized protein n=1 Tax=Candidatus Falkowbacteria bacterium RIFCSPLOWO2_12_FULL_45_10 TaxID=1797990 RepID=A0A1F5RVN0_9BACT|nr:MAG: hypothetical protein A3G56_01905 [Candidatus Falkowbacteria bacterium RIFCSPLOWO2_12_FULL_45_10]
MDKIDNFNLDESYQQKSDEEYISGDDYREQLQNLQPKQAPSFSWQQKLASAFLVVFGVSALILWAVQFKGGLQITKPLTAEELAQLNQSKNPEAAALDSLRNQDTDQDGLSDYDELYAYNTSPYLEDSDSDGIADKKEVEQNTDPNCPAGQSCAEQTTSSPSAPAATAPLDAPGVLSAGLGAAQPNSAPFGSPAAGGLDASSPDASKVLGGEVDAATLRALLRSAGMSADILDKISDEQLMQVYEQTLKGQQNN